MFVPRRQDHGTRSMLTYGTYVQVTKGGETCRVEDLMIGQKVFNPFSEGVDEIIDILTRSVKCHSECDQWVPIELPVGVMSENRPSQPLLVSRKQPVMMKKISAGKRVHEIDITEAYKVMGAQNHMVDEITYTAIFFVKSRPVLANNALCMAYTNDIYDN